MPASMAGMRVRPGRLVLVGSVVVDALLYVAASLSVERPGPSTSPTAAELRAALDEL